MSMTKTKVFVQTCTGPHLCRGCGLNYHATPPLHGVAVVVAI